jgi:hypothetical protein
MSPKRWWKRWEQDIKSCVPKRSGDVSEMVERGGLLWISTGSGDAYSAKFLHDEGFELREEQRA